MSQQYFIGIDGGGTNTRAILADRTGRVLGYARAGSTNRNHYSREQVLANMRDVLRNALGNRADGGEPSAGGVPEFPGEKEQTASARMQLQAGSPHHNLGPGNSGTPLAGIFLGMCGVSTDSDRREIAAIVREIPEVPASARIDVENDTHIGLLGGLSGRPGIVLIAGTGSACFGLDASGGSYFCAGWGALADDAGSAPWIGLQAINAAVKSEDGRLGPTALREIVFRFLGLAHPREFIDRVHNRGLSREQIGKLAPLVIEAHRKGDAVAAEILHRAVAELAAMVAVTARKLFGDGPCEVILVGGLALSGAPFTPMLIDRIRRDAPGATVREAEMSPVHGAALAALKAAGIPLSAQVLANLRSHSGAVE